MKRKGVKNLDSPDVRERLVPDILGRIGAELLSEFAKSAFTDKNAALGLICMRMEVCQNILAAVTTKRGFLIVTKGQRSRSQCMDF